MIKTKKKKLKTPTKTIKSVFDDKPRGKFITVKTSLKSILKDYNNNYPIINTLVCECNEIVIRTYQLIRMFILYKYYKKETIPVLDKVIILYFIRAGGIRNKKGKGAKNKLFETELDDFYNNEYQPCINKQKYNLMGKGFVIPYLAQHIETAFSNNLKVHFITRMRRFMNIMNPDDTTDKKEFNKVKNLILLDKHNEIPKKYKKWSKNIQKKYLPDKYEKCYAYDVKVTPEKYLLSTIKMNEEVEKLNMKIKNDKKLTDEEKRCKTKKLFQPIPLRNSIIPGYITIDAFIILSLFKKKGEYHLTTQIKKKERKLE